MGFLKPTPSGVKRKAAPADTSCSVLVMGWMLKVVGSSTAPEGISSRTTSPYHSTPPCGPSTTETASPTGCPLDFTSGTPKTGPGSPSDGVSFLQQTDSRKNRPVTSR